MPQEKKFQGKRANRKRRSLSWSSRLRRFSAFLLCFIVTSLLVGKIFEVLTAPATYQAAGKIQESWKRSLHHYTPFALAEGYVNDVVTVYEKGPDAFFSDPRETGDDRAPEPAVPLTAECDALFTAARRDCSAVGDGSRAECSSAVDEARKKFLEIPACRAWNDQRLAEERIRDRALELELRQHNRLPGANEDNKLLRAFMAPVFGLVKTFLRLIEPGGWSYFWGALQIAMGVPGFMLAHAAYRRDPIRPRYFPEHPLSWMLIVPPGVILAASLLAFPLKYLMIGGLDVLGWFTGLAGVCCSATGVAGLCWWFAHSFAEYSVSEAIERKFG